MGRRPVLPPTWESSGERAWYFRRLHNSDGRRLRCWAVVLLSDGDGLTEEDATAVVVEPSEEDLIEFIHSHFMELVYGPTGDHYKSLPYRLMLITSNNEIDWDRMASIKEAIESSSWQQPVSPIALKYPSLVLARHVTTKAPRPYLVWSTVPDATPSSVFVERDAWSSKGTNTEMISLKDLYKQKYQLDTDASQEVFIASASPAPLKPGGKAKPPSSKSTVYLLPHYVQVHPVEVGASDSDERVKSELQEDVPFGLRLLARDIAIAHVCACLRISLSSTSAMSEALSAYDGLNGRLAWLGDAFWRVLVNDRYYWSNDYQADSFVELCDNFPCLAEATLYEPLTLMPPKNPQAVRNKRYADTFEAILGVVGLHQYKQTGSIEQAVDEMDDLECFITPDVRKGNVRKSPETIEWRNLRCSLIVWKEFSNEGSLSKMNERRNALLTSIINSPP
ncbi:hypothetical protein FOL47_005815 [Perkinsus chesapeaki]|uniref:Uncharacterized protein n=1 Tax=Perkinsus chesapeaki TaxID=330153 RepID=A0A7J6LVF8_PERCH|nr:hypothetical protein FOL47_005815 [Perkinsus chesapeaki]